MEPGSNLYTPGRISRRPHKWAARTNPTTYSHAGKRTKNYSPGLAADPGLDRRIRRRAGGWAAVKQKNKKMHELISENFQIARKEYNCMACEWLFNNLSDYWSEMTFSEKKAAVIAMRQKEKILPGQSYIRQFCSDSGEKYTYRAIPEIHDICLRLIYPNID